MLKGWEEKKLGELGVFSKGSGVCRADSNSGKLPCIRYGEIYMTHNDYIKEFTSFISREVAQTAKQLKQGDLLFTGSGETKEEIGKCVAFIYDYEAYAGGDIIILSPDNDIDSMFMGFMLNTPNVNKQKASKGQGDAIVHITAKSLADVSVVLPPLPEQHAIATALSDTGALITAMEKLIAKKRVIKQGAMQELLTGKRRLPGFSGKWVEKKLGEIALDIKTGKRNNEDKIENGKYPFFVRSQQIERINDYVYNCEAILVPGEGNIGQIFHYINGKFDCHQRVYKISEFIDVAAIFIFYYMKMFFGRYALINTVKATVDSLRLPTFEKFEMVIPQDKAEQTAIANILSDMDAEIDVLTAKLNKLRHIKQGMMSELLTGRIRLVQPEPVIVSVQPKAKIVEFKPKELKKQTAANGHNQAIEDAVILAVVTDLYATPQFPLAPFYAQKFPYLLHRHIEGIAKGYHKLAAGPYNSELEYRTALPIALRNKYVVSRKVTYKGNTFKAILVGGKIEQAKSYFLQWHGDEPLKWLEQFKHIDTRNRRNELELLTTVDMAMVELRYNNALVTISAVKEIIEKSPEWKAKLKREIFSDANIARAINWSNNLFGDKNNAKN